MLDYHRICYLVRLLCLLVVFKFLLCYCYSNTLLLSGDGAGGTGWHGLGQFTEKHLLRPLHCQGKTQHPRDEAWIWDKSRLHNMCELTSCLHLPDPVMLTAAALVKDETDLVTSEDVNDQMRTNAMVSINNLRNGLGLGGRPDAVTAKSQRNPSVHGDLALYCHFSLYQAGPGRDPAAPGQPVGAP